MEKCLQPTCVFLLSRIGNSRSVAGSDDFLKIRKWCQKEAPRGPSGALVREFARLAPRGPLPKRGARQKSSAFVDRSPLPASAPGDHFLVISIEISKFCQIRNRVSELFGAGFGSKMDQDCAKKWSRPRFTFGRGPRSFLDPILAHFWSRPRPTFGAGPEHFLDRALLTFGSGTAPETGHRRKMKNCAPNGTSE